MDTTPREYTPEEIRTKFINHIWTMINYWENESTTPNTKDKLEGLAHSMLAMLDGAQIGLPAFYVIPMAHPSDKDFHIKNGENYYPYIELNSKFDMGILHHHLFNGRK